MQRSIGHIEEVDAVAAWGQFKSGPMFGRGFDFPNNSVELDGEKIVINIGDEVIHMVEKMDHLDGEQEAYLVVQQNQTIIFHVDGDKIENVGIYRTLH